jgi:outer membrane protein assembly factor BamB
VPSPLLYENVLYLVKRGGIVTTVDPETGEILKQGRLRDALDSYYASPVAADGKVFFVSEAGKVAVVKAGGKDWEVLAINNLGEECYATPALGEGRIYLRTRTTLYAFGQVDGLGGKKKAKRGG